MFFVFFARKLLIYYQKYFKCKFRNQEKNIFSRFKILFVLINFYQISHWAFYQRGTINCFKWFCTIEQDGCHIHIWLKTLKNLLLENQGSFEAESFVYSIEGSSSTKVVQVTMVGWHLTFLWQGQISVLVAVAMLEECCMASADMQWLFYSGEQIMAHGHLVLLC